MPTPLTLPGGEPPDAGRVPKDYGDRTCRPKTRGHKPPNRASRRQMIAFTNWSGLGPGRPVSAVASSQSRVASPHIFRNSLTTRLYAVGLLIPVGICAGYVFVVPAIGAKVPLALVALGGVLLIVRMLRAGIAVTNGGISVRGLIRDRTASWANVTSFGFASGTPLNSTVYVAVHLSDGSRLCTTGLTAASKTSEFGLRAVASMKRSDQANRALGLQRFTSAHRQVRTRVIAAEERVQLNARHRRIFGCNSPATNHVDPSPKYGSNVTPSPILTLAEITVLEQAYLAGDGPVLGPAKNALANRWNSGLRDRETALRAGFPGVVLVQ